MCNVQQAEGATRPGPPVCRNLFGPVDHAELSRELRSRLREMREESSRRWDFDFQRGVPLPSSRYAWEESRLEAVPAFYRETPGHLETPSPTQCPRGEPPCPSPPLSPEIPSPSLSPEPPQPGPTTGTASKKRSQPAAPITDFSPVRKKTKVQGLCEKLRSLSPIPTEHTPRKMCR
ncbi:cyclin-dependent kinase inhibitor 1B-like [Pseudophryne corroboree]|uniref:cyclin-dependent kinase inhibitor 1B-like n=1 Tax=Pseudophryne corroboree TaxID=495146 RepID=UPI00308141BE